VWLDYDDIEPGTQFEEALNQALAQSDNLLAIIGPDWLTASKDGHRRLDDPEDWVRREVAAGLAGRAAVTPVLVGNAQLPAAEELPEPLQALPARQAIEVRPERFDDDVEDLIRRIGGWRRRWHGFPLWAWAATITAVVALLFVAFLVRGTWRLSSTPTRCRQSRMCPKRSTSSPGRPTIGRGCSPWLPTRSPPTKQRLRTSVMAVCSIRLLGPSTEVTLSGSG
jgi:hypothetical protein